MEILVKNRMNYRKVVVFIIFSLFLFSFFLVRADSSFARTTETLPAEVLLKQLVVNKEFRLLRGV